MKHKLLKKIKNDILSIMIIKRFWISDKLNPILKELEKNKNY